MTGSTALLLSLALALAVPGLAVAADATAPPPAATPLPPVSVVATGPIPSPDQVMAIPPALLALLHARVITPSLSREQRLQRLITLIFDAQGMNLGYDADATLTVAETWETRRANCLAFTLLFVSLAREAGIDAHVQEVNQVVSWYQDQGVIYSVGHVNAGVNLGGRSAVVDLDRNVLYDREGPRQITRERALAHFYNNRGAARMAAGDLVLARAYFRQSLQMSPEFASGWNNLGVLDTREGRLQAAVVDFRSALRYAPQHAAALSNASTLYTRMGDTREAERLSRRLALVHRRDPFVQYMLGADAEKKQDYAQAIRYYKRAVRLYEEAHQFHFGLARAYFMVGDTQHAGEEMQRARALGGDALQQRYQAKLDSLNRWRLQNVQAR
jgi:tetratricopeptide (TPR) repeat protein